jgi:hypothetical protein
MMQTTEVGKKVKSSKKQILWYVGLGSQNWKITVTASVLSKKRVIVLNERKMYEGKGFLCGRNTVFFRVDNKFEVEIYEEGGFLPHPCPCPQFSCRE